jgi:phosphatidylglycerol:prolipoprotein diacylglycerol transferase
VTLGTYGLLVATGLICAYFVVRRDFTRRGIRTDADTIIGVTGLAGMAGARLYHLLETPAAFFANPLPLLFSTMGFAWFGAFLGGFIALVLLARHYRVAAMLMLDVAAPAAALGYGIGRMGCLISGDGDYGIPTSLPWGMSFPNGLIPTTERVHPTPIYEAIAAFVLAYFLWRMGRSQLNRESLGRIFGVYLIGTGVARFLVEFIRINPRSVLGMSNAQAVAVLCVIAGIGLLALLPQRAPAARRT